MRKSNNTGITLIALIITIIVLLILSAVTFTFVLGDNGIISKAQIAKEKTNLSQEDENTDLKDLENVIENYQNGTRTLGSEKELLYANENGYSEAGSITLNKPWTNYSYLMFIDSVGNKTEITEHIISKESLQYIYSDKTNKRTLFPGYYTYYVQFWIESDTILKIAKTANTGYIFYIYGIK